MKIWAKVTFKDGSQVQQLTLKVEGKGEEAELELALGGESQTLEAPVEGQTETEGALVSETPVQPEANVQPTQEISKEPEEEIQSTPVVSTEPEVETEEVSAEPKTEAEEPGTVGDDIPENEVQAEPTSVQSEVEIELASEPVTATSVSEPEVQVEPEVEAESEPEPEPEPVSANAPVTVTPAEESGNTPKVVEQPASTPEVVADAVDDEADDGEEEDSQEILEVAKIAQESTSFDGFVEKVMLWVKIERNHRDYFKAVINAATQAGKISWKHIESIMKRDGVRVNAYSKLRISKSVATKFQNSPKRVTILKLIKDVVSYKKSFSNEHQDAPVNTADKATQATSTKFQQVPVARVKMSCMPEIKEFEEALGRIDKKEPFDERVKAVFVAMGLNEISSEDSQLLLGITNVAINLKNINLDTVFNNLEIPEQLRTSARMKFSSFLNNFIEQHSPDAHMVKTLDFLKDLQHVLLSEQEISALV